MGTLVSDQGARVVDVLPRSRVCCLLDLIRRRQLVHLDDRVRPVEQELRVGTRDTQHRTDDRHRVWLGIVGKQVERSSVGALVEEFVRNRGDWIGETSD